MNTVLRYFKYHFVKTLYVIPLILVIIATVIAPATVYSGWYSSGIRIDFQTTDLAIIVAAFVIPFLQLNMFNNRRNLDLWYSFPIDRRSLLAVHYITGLIHVLFSVFAMYVSIIINVIRFSDDFYMSKIYGFIIYMILFAVASYSLSFFAYTIANNNFDGCVFMFLYYNLVYVVASSVIGIYCNINKYQYRDVPHTDIFSYSEDYFDICNFYRYDVDRMAIDRYGAYEFPTSSLISFLIFTVIYVGVAVAVILLANKRVAYKVGGVSDSWFGYKTLLPVMLTLLSLSADGAGLMLILLLFIAYGVFRRSIKFKREDYRVIIAIVALMIIYGIASGIFNWGIVYHYDY